MELPPVNVAPAPPATQYPSPTRGPFSGDGSSNACVNPGSGSGQALDCLNLKLRQQVDQVNPGSSVPSAPLDARSIDTKIGIVNVPAVQQQYGKNFGVSAAPYRPPPLIYSSPVGRR
jgi:hypothetical protein